MKKAVKKTPPPAGSTAKVQFGKILVPVDFSPRSQELLQFAIRFAKQNHGRLILVHVVEPVFFMGDAGYPGLTPLPVTDDNTKGAITGLKKLQSTMPTALKTDIHVRVGRPHIEITNAAKELGADLIIISTHGYTGLSHVMMGSTAEHVIRYASCPVLTVRKRD
jgi:universal stress protein A